MSNHAIERCEERGIGIMEAYAAISEPDKMPSADAGKLIYVRGDLKVVVAPKGHHILTVADRNADWRVKEQIPRQPVNPLIDRGRRSMPRKANGGSFDLAWILAAHTEPDMRKLLITPELATKLLEDHNTGNRPLRASTVQTYVDAINNGEWKLTHQGVAIDTKQVLQDGQHRLKAIEVTGKAQEMFVAVGMPPENFTVIDVGKVRNYADSLTLQGHTNSYQLGALLRLVFVFMKRDFTSTHKVSITAVNELMHADPDGFLVALHWGAKVKRGANANMTAAGAAYYLIRRVNTLSNTTEFFDRVEDGADIGKDHPAWVLRRSLRNSEGNSRQAPEQLAWFIKAWNAYAERRVIQLLSWGRGQEMPRVTRMEKAVA